jgi:hypothetical protein
MTGEERGDVLEGLAPRLDEMVEVAPGEFDVFRAWYVISYVPAVRGPRVVGVLEDEGWRGP